MGARTVSCLCLLLIVTGGLATQELKNSAARTLLQAFTVSTARFSGAIQQAVSDIEGRPQPEADETGTVVASADSGAVAAFESGRGSVQGSTPRGRITVPLPPEPVRPPPDSFVRSLARAVTDRFTADVSNSVSDFLSQLEGSCDSIFVDPELFAEVVASALIDELEAASSFVIFADDNAAIQALASATKPAFETLVDSACSGANTDAAAGDLANAISAPYERVVLEALTSVAARSSCGITVQFVNGGIVTGCPTGDLEVCSFRLSLCCRTQRPSCRCGAGCRANRFTLSNGVGYEVTESGSRGVQVGDRCRCA